MSGAYRPFGAFRFGLALLVVVSHTHVLAGRGPVLAPYGLGNLGVMTFFVLSGFVIAEALEVFYSHRPGAFLINRVLRIHPPFFFALGVSLALHWLVFRFGTLKFFDDAVSPSAIFSVSNIAGNALSMIVVAGLGRLGFEVAYPLVRYSWAVAVELVFYLGAAMLLYLSLRIALRRRPLFVAAIAVGLGIAFLYAMLPEGKPVFFLGWIPSFALGAGMYRLSANKPGAPVFWLTVWVAASLAALNWHAYWYMSRNPQSLVGVTLVLLDALIAAVWLLGRSRIASAKWLRVDRILGDLTYPLYLNHYAIAVVVLSTVPESRFGLPLFGAYVAASIGAAYLAMQACEPFTARLREQIRGQRLR